MAAAATRLALKVTPSASRAGLAGWLGEALKVRVRAPAERGKANAAVEALLAETLGVPARDARIVSGHGASRKVLEVAGLSPEEVRRRIDAALEAGA